MNVVEKNRQANRGKFSEKLPLLSIVVPVFNEQALVESHLYQLITYLQSLENEFRWELLIINDGSDDETSEIIENVAGKVENVNVLHHPRNFGLGQALCFGFANSKGDYVITLDIDLSYSVEHVGILARAIQESQVKLVLASPYMKGGRIEHVPWKRRILSILGNKFLKFFVKGRYTTLTSLMRAYDGEFIRSMNLRSVGMDILPEIILKTQILKGTILEVPGALDWGPQNMFSTSRFSSMRVIRHIFATIFAGFIFRPFLFFIIPGLFLFVFSLYVNFWMFMHYFEAVEVLKNSNELTSFSQALAVAYKQYPHTYIFGLLTAMLAIQVLGLGVRALQSKHYFEELFFLGSHSFREKLRKKKL